MKGIRAFASIVAALSTATTPAAGTPDYWRLLPHYRPQVSDAACSVASVAMALGALGVRGIDQPVLMAADADWRLRAQTGGDGVSFAEMTTYLHRVLDRAGMADARLTVFHPAGMGADQLDRLRSLLRAAADGTADVVLVSFDQGWLWGEDSAGHVSPVGDYDAERGMVLIMDVDPAHFGPLWLPEQTLLAAMVRAGVADPDGVLVITRQGPPGQQLAAAPP
ncbi:MAG TPA: phytochelatin synthase family protein [Magnetospirillum sp.]|nr:phytochelatin synthase family protein [Magnetospirillum sp.]